MSVRTAILEDYKKLLSELDNETFDFYLFKPSDTTPPVKVSIPGLPYSMSSEGIALELKEQDVNVLNVAQTKKGTGDNTIPLPLFLITIPHNDKVRNITKINSIGYSRVKREPYAKPREPVQCYTCQRYNHEAKFCHAQPSCLKRRKGHESRDCTDIQNDDIKCANCNDKHTANYCGCPNYKILVKKMQNAKTNAK